ncbi:hypothetical protein DOTSEDRAFT_69097 [Lecanosticta acicola]|uniref:Uncharacterized protein n=1 Tax=Lecanosticta acicola TaxID=111012 RepID=A0AAI8Z798_9PEZI|nr:hypothetical protein DOTSEDRAFT_69097 [Lecanosticta acicola]
MSHSWLQRQRKQALIDLAAEAGLKQDEDLRKDEIVENLNAHLQQNATALSRVRAFEDYYGKRRATPGRPPRESTAAFLPRADEVEVEAEVKSVVKRGGKRATKVKPEPEDEGPVSSPIRAAAAAASTAKNAIATVSSALSPTALSPSAQLTSTSYTPAPRMRRRSELPGPPSPADVADIVEHESSKVVAGIRHLYARSGITENIEYLREVCSSVVAVQFTFLLIEAFALQRRLMPWRFAFSIPSTGFTPTISVQYPDLFILLTGFYWSTAFLWSATSVFIPLVFAYFYNLTIRDVKRGNLRVSVARYAADPLTFNVVKALATWLVYSRGVSFGFIDAEVSERVDLAMFGGSTLVLIGSGIGALAALYEAAQKKGL